eukprot:4225268-Alexandrium_andersonii.AAC.1
MQCPGIARAYPSPPRTSRELQPTVGVAGGHREALHLRLSLPICATPWNLHNAPRCGPPRAPPARSSVQHARSAALLGEAPESRRALHAGLAA